MSDCEIVLVRGVDDANGHLCGGMSIAECCDCGASLWAAMWDCSQDGGTRGRASRSRSSARKAIRLYERCWCRGRTTFWGHLERTAIRGAWV